MRIYKEEEKHEKKSLLYYLKQGNLHSSYNALSDNHMSKKQDYYYTVDLDNEEDYRMKPSLDIQFDLEKDKLVGYAKVYTSRSTGEDHREVYHDPISFNKKLSDCTLYDFVNWVDSIKFTMDPYFLSQGIS